jgi:hypothetical protein
MHVSVGAWIAIVVFTAILLLAKVNVGRRWRGERSRRASSERTLRGRPSVVVLRGRRAFGGAAANGRALHTWHIPGTYRVHAQSRGAGNACNDGVALSDRDVTPYRVRPDRSG